MTYERHDRVRLLVPVDDVPAGTEGIIMGPQSPSGYLVQIAGWGVREVPDTQLELVQSDS
jgi:hypothetical protein